MDRGAVRGCPLGHEVAVSYGHARVDGDIILLRTHPRSGANALAAALNERIRELWDSPTDFRIDFDYLTSRDLLAGFFHDLGNLKPLLIVKTHLSQMEFVRRYSDLLPLIRCQIFLYRTPLDVAFSTYHYLSGLPGGPGVSNQQFGDFFSNWIRSGGTTDAFDSTGYSSWEQYAYGALDSQQPIPGPIVHLTYDEVLASAERTANVVCALPEMERLFAGKGGSVQQAVVPGHAVATEISVRQADARGSYFAAGRFGELIAAEQFGDRLLEYIARFAAPVNRLIRERSIPVKLL